MDGLWFYDVNAYQWVTMYPGTDTRSPPALRVTDDGFERNSENRPVPIATIVHGYEMMAWDLDHQIFFSMPNHHSCFAKALPSVATFRAENKSCLNRSDASPWMFDPWNRKWHRLKTATASPKSGYGSVLMYIPFMQKLLFYRLKGIPFYDPDKNP